MRRPASFHILDLVNNVGIMAYRNATVFVGVEASPVARVELPKLTFDGRSNAEMDDELALADAAFSGQKSFAGFAIHHYLSYRDRFTP